MSNKLVYEKKCVGCDNTITISQKFPENYDATELVSVTRDLNIVRDFCDPCNTFTAFTVTVLEPQIKKGALSTPE